MNLEIKIRSPRFSITWKVMLCDLGRLLESDIYFNISNIKIVAALKVV